MMQSLRNVKNGEIITCVLIGTMCTGEKVWQDKSGNQYLRIKIGKHFYFAHI